VFHTKQPCEALRVATRIGLFGIERACLMRRAFRE
jgi:hypothetical protein